MLFTLLEELLNTSHTGNVYELVTLCIQIESNTIDETNTSFSVPVHFLI